MLMLQSVIRCSIERHGISEPPNSMTWPVPPAIPSRPTTASAASLALTPSESLPSSTTRIALRLSPHQTLRRQHLLDLGRADAERQRAERAMRRGVAVTADDRHAGLRQAEFRTDDVDDALIAGVEVEERNAEIRAVSAQRIDLRARQRIGDRQMAGGRGHVVIDRGEGPVGAPHATSRRAQPAERLRRRDFVHEMQVDVEQRQSVVELTDDVRIPEPIEERLRNHYGSSGASRDRVRCDAASSPAVPRNGRDGNRRTSAHRPTALTQTLADQTA